VSVVQSFESARDSDIKEKAKMKVRSVITSLLSAAMSCVALGQPPQAKTRYKDEAPPAVEKVLAVSKAGTELLPSLVSVKPQAPLGPDSVLQEYENEMTLVSQRMSVEVQSIAHALRLGQITHDQAEFLIQQRYQVAMMQYEVFTALHDALEQAIQQAATDRSNGFSADPSESSVRARLTSSSAHSPGQ
jgi:hypothetical protein